MFIRYNQKTAITLYFFLFVLLIAGMEIRPSAAQEQLYINRIAKIGSVGYDVCVSGDYAYIVGNDGVDIFDISNPHNPSKAGDLEIENGAFGITVIGNLVYASAQAKGLVIADITNKAEPSMISQTAVGGVSTKTFIDGDYAYVTSYDIGLTILNISNIAAPSIVGDYYDSGRIDCVWANGNYVYLANTNLGLEVLDVSDKSSPTRVKLMPSLGGATDLHRCGDLLFVSTYASSVFVLNISTASNPVIIGTHSDTDEGEAQGVVGNSTHVFVADNYGVEFLDISNLPQITEVAENRQGISSAHDVDFKDNFIFIAGGSIATGLLIFEISNTEKTNIGYYVGIPTTIIVIAISTWLIIRYRKKKIGEIS